MNKYKDIGGILVIAEHDGSRLHRVTFELLGIAERLSEKKNMPVSCLFVGPDNVDLAADDIPHSALEASETSTCISISRGMTGRTR